MYETKTGRTEIQLAKIMHFADKNHTFKTSIYGHRMIEVTLSQIEMQLYIAHG